MSRRRLNAEWCYPLSATRMYQRSEEKETLEQLYAQLVETSRIMNETGVKLCHALTKTASDMADLSARVAEQLQDSKMWKEEYDRVTGAVSGDR